jgi:Fur family transcriptional regulator, ferric uptake regulator
MRARMPEKAAVKRLKEAGLEVTEHRVQVLMAVGNTAHPSSATEIQEKISLKNDINRVTVYRILDLLVEHEVLNRLGLGEKSQRFCLRSAHEDEHPHFHCTHCGCYLCLSMPDLPLNRRALDDLSLDIRHVDIRLEGVCPACQKNTSRQPVPASLDTPAAKPNAGQNT